MSLGTQAFKIFLFSHFRLVVFALMVTGQLLHLQCCTYVSGKEKKRKEEGKPEEKEKEKVSEEHLAHVSLAGSGSHTSNCKVI